MYSPSLLAYSLLGLLLIGALASLILGLRPRLQRMQRGRAETPVSAEPQSGFLGRELNAGTFLHRALLTERLWGRLPTGLAHSLLYFGALVSIAGHAEYALEFVGINVYVEWPWWLLTRPGREIAGICMLLGAAFLLARRLVKPAPLVAAGERKGFTAMEILLLVTIVAGFVTESFRLAVPGENRGGEFLGAALARLYAGWSPGAVADGNMTLWWLHGLLGVSFAALIGRTPMSHMLLGPLNSALVRRRSGIQMPPIDFEAPEEQEVVLGAARLADMPRKLLLDFDACLGCGRCHEACPATQTGKVLSPKRIMMVCGEYQSQGRLDDAQLLDDIGAEAIFDCTTCAACIEVCPVSNSPAEAILEFRRNLTMERSEMPETLAAANRNMESRGHPFVGTAANPDDWHKGLDVPLFEAGKTEYLLWIGCAIRYEERAQQVARAMVRILNAAGVGWGILEGERCTGDPAKTSGNELLFVEMASSNIEMLQQERVTQIVTMCAHGFNAFDRYYPELGANWTTIPHSVLIDRFIRDGKLEVVRDEGELITYHDPCYLARHNDITDEPRSALAAVGSLIEMPRNRKQSMCCGAGGCNYWKGGTSGTARINEVRTKEALDTGAKKIATSCSYCLLMLSSSASVSGGERKVFDIAEIVADKLPQAADALH
ncbi:MAG: 4Fe-4S dicluster domain-containing protein [Proteobacteria bacterium]|nr:4Fe-4S dicluster domain-containing protein [Pseudomonadota bacterium]